MNNIKNELQRIILGDEPVGGTSQLKKVQSFLRRYAETGSSAKKQQRFKSEEAATLLNFAHQENLFYGQAIIEDDFIASGAEQRVYRLDETHVIKTNSSIFYEYWLDYFNSLLLHNYFFPATSYTFLGFKKIGSELFAIVRQEFITTTETTDLAAVKNLLTYNHFSNTRNNDYASSELGVIFEDLHDENVLTKEGALFFIDTIFYLTPQFYLK